jgi:hypothetical protein
MTLSKSLKTLNKKLRGANRLQLLVLHFTRSIGDSISLIQVFRYTLRRSKILFKLSTRTTWTMSLPSMTSTTRNFTKFFLLSSWQRVRSKRTTTVWIIKTIHSSSKCYKVETNTIKKLSTTLLSTEVLHITLATTVEFQSTRTQGKDTTIQELSSKLFNMLEDKWHHLDRCNQIDNITINENN